jgi:transposase
MPTVPVFAGLDYHQDCVQVCVLNSDGKSLINRSLPNNSAKIHQALTQAGEPIRIGIEACCGAADLAEELISIWNLPVQLAHPGYVNRMKQSPDKTDYSDAQLLADLSRVNYLPKVWLAPRELRELRRLIRHRKQLVDRRKQTKLRIRGLLRENRLKCPNAKAWTKDWVIWLRSLEQLSESDRWIIEDHYEELLSLDKRIVATELRIKQLTQDDHIVQWLLSQKGVGLVTASLLRAEIGRVDRFHSGKQLARFCGVTPRNASSGNRQADAGLIRAGNPDLRTTLIELAHRLIRQADGPWRPIAAAMLTRGKPKNVIVAAIANRWVRKLFHLWPKPGQMQNQLDSLGSVRGFSEESQGKKINKKKPQRTKTA